MIYIYIYINITYETHLSPLEIHKPKECTLHLNKTIDLKSFSMNERHDSAFIGLRTGLPPFHLLIKPNEFIYRT